MSDILDAIRAAQLFHKWQKSKDYEDQRRLVENVRGFLKENNIDEAELLQTVNTTMKLWQKVRQIKKSI